MNIFLTSEEVANATIKMFNTNENDLEKCNSNRSDTTNSLYDKLAEDLENHIDALSMNITKTKQYTNIIRIGLFQELNWKK